MASCSLPARGPVFSFGFCNPHKHPNCGKRRIRPKGTKTHLPKRPGTHATINTPMNRRSKNESSSLELCSSDGTHISHQPGHRRATKSNAEAHQARQRCLAVACNIVLDMRKYTHTPPIHRRKTVHARNRNSPNYKSKYYVRIEVACRVGGCYFSLLMVWWFCERFHTVCVFWCVWIWGASGSSGRNAVLSCW